MNDRALAICRCATRITKRITLWIKIALRENIKPKRRSKLPVLISSRSLALRVDRAITDLRFKRRTIQKFYELISSRIRKREWETDCYAFCLVFVLFFEKIIIFNLSLIKKFTFIVLRSIRPFSNDLTTIERTIFFEIFTRFASSKIFYKTVTRFDKSILRVCSAYLLWIRLGDRNGRFD